MQLSSVRRYGGVRNYGPDITSTSLIHASDRSYGTITNPSDDNTATYIQNFTYCSIDFVEVKRIGKFGFYSLNSYTLSNAKLGVFQGSNNNVAWDTLVPLANMEIDVGWNYIEFENPYFYRYYRVSGFPKNNNSVLEEWEMFEIQ